MVPEHTSIRSIPRRSAENTTNNDSDALHRAKSRALIDLLNELRTPLMMIKSPLQTQGIGDEGMTAELLDQAERIQEGIEKALEVLEMDLLEADDQDVSSEFASVVDRYISSLGPLSDRCGVTVKYASEVSRVVVHMHLSKIQHLLEAVIEGTVRSTAFGGTVDVRLAAERREDAWTIVLVVERSGDFVSGSSITRLALARRHLAACGGTLTESPHRWEVRLPADEPDFGSEDDVTECPPSGYESQDTPSDTADGQTTVLIVDDHPGTRAYLRYALRKHHRVFEAPDGRAGLEIVREHRPDLVISDIMMPNMDGNELCRTIKADEALRHIPVFLVTANAMPSVKVRGLECGADDYLVKPFDVDEAVMRINNEIKARNDLKRRYSRQLVIKPSDITVTSEDEALIKRAAEVVERNMENGDFSVQELAIEIGLSSRQLQRRLREIADQSPVEFIRKLRLQRAAQLLEARYGNVSEVAYRVGFTSLSYFAKCFKEEFGMSPSVFKEQGSDA